MNRKFLLFLLLILFLILPAVAANDTTWYVGGNTTVGGQGTVDNPYYSMDSAISNLDDNDNIVINEGIYTGVNNTNLVVSRDNVVIRANGNVTFTGSKIFDVSGYNVLITGLNFVNCTDNVIHNSQFLTVTNSSFYNNNYIEGTTITSERNAVLIVDSSILTANITNCVFINNHANRDGGAVKNYGGIMNIKNCTFINNTAYGYDDSYGGAVYQWIGTIGI